MRWLPSALALSMPSSIICMAAGSSPTPRPSTMASKIISATQQPLFSFGVIADVQWADTEDGYNFDKTVARKYRGAFRNLIRAVDWWNGLPEPPNFIAQLGDLIDGINVKLGDSMPALEAALTELERAPCPTINIVGNHELYNFDRQALSRASWLRHGDAEYYSFKPAPGWRFVVLDPYQQALIGHAADDPRRREAVKLISKRNPGVDPSGVGGEWFKHVSGYDRRFVPYNGGLGSEQLAWLRGELHDASALGERVCILCHVILHPEACGGSTMVWDYPDALQALGETSCVVAVLCGHDHFGQYHKDDNGIHHMTFCSPLNKGDEGAAFGLVHVWEDALELRSPCVDDLLPATRRGQSTGRPTKRQCVGVSGSQEESVWLPLRPCEDKRSSDAPSDAATADSSDVSASA